MRNRWLAGMMLALVPGVVSAPAWAETKPTTARAFLGVSVEAPKDAAGTGALVRAVTPDSPAAKAGLKTGDLIIKIDKQAVSDPKALVEGVAAHKPGDKLSVQLMRDGKEQTLHVTLAERTVGLPPSVREFLANKHGAFLGVRAQDLTAAEKKRLDVTLEKGAVVMEVVSDSPAARAGLKPDDVITAVNGQAVANPEELRAAIQKVGAGKETTLKVMRGKEVKEIKASLDEMPLGLSELRGLNPELKRQIEEMQKRLREFEEHLAPPAK